MRLSIHCFFCKWAPFLGLGVFILVSGCRNSAKLIEKERLGLDESWASRAAAYPNRDIKVLNWDDAIKLMRERNPQVLRAVEERERAKRAITQVYKNLLPAMQLRAGIDKRVSELNHLSFDDIRLDLNLYAFFSGILNLRRDVFTAELSYIRANLVSELTLREKTVELYQVFTASRQLQSAKKRLDESERVLREIPRSSRTVESAPATVNAMRNQISGLEAKINGQLVKSLDVTDYRLELKDEGVPRVDYQQSPLLAIDVARVGVLRRKLFAIELVGAQARVRGAKLQYWPDLSFFLTSGSLWTTSGGQTVWWSSSDLQLSVSAYLPIDLNGQIRNRVREAKSDMEFLKREMNLREGVLIAEFDDKRRALVGVETELVELERKRRLLLQLIAIEGMDNIGERLRQWIDAETRRESALDRRADLTAFFMFFDEVFWAGMPSPAPQPTDLPLATPPPR
jgi:hypothetical protein